MLYSQQMQTKKKHNDVNALRAQIRKFANSLRALRALRWLETPL